MSWTNPSPTPLGRADRAHEQPTRALVSCRLGGCALYDDPCQRRACQNYSTLTLAALITGHHFAISAFCQAPSACGDSLSFGGICRPRFSSCLRTAGSFSASTAAALSFATISLGVPFGTHRPDHSVM